MKSTQFDDIYFSVQDGLAETRHTFLDGNDLPTAWAGRARFCICETGFGTGLNMLAAWRLFEETAGPDQRLDLISIEKYPLDKNDIRIALAQWDLQPQLDRMLDCYPLRVRGFHRLNLTPRVTLTLVFDDVLDALPQLQAQVDSWFLDGFAPAKNPDMWSDALYAGMARLSAPGAHVATFAAAGHVRRGLAAAGFAVEKRAGYGRKRDMTAGRFTGAGAAAPACAGRVSIVGAGIAGLSAAWHLRRAGVDVSVYDANGAASGASGNSIGLINPKLSAQPSPHSDYYTSAFAYACHMLRDLGLYDGQGSLHLQTDDDRARRFDAYTRNLGWHGDHMRLLDAQAASDAAGVRLDVPCLLYPDAAATSPRDLCAALAQGIDVQRADIHDLAGMGVVVLANAAGVTRFCPLPVGAVRGQVSQLQGDARLSALRTNLCYGGYVSTARGGVHMCGATFQPWDGDPAVRDDDHARNLHSLAQAVPSLDGAGTVSGGWTGFRAAARDRFPFVGQVGAHTYVSAAHGSHGIISGLMAGAQLAALLAGGPQAVGAGAANALSPGRFMAIASTES